MTKEAIIQKHILLALTDAGCTVWRNETAGAWTGKASRCRDGMVTIEDARFIHAGLCTGSADIIGISPDGRFLAVEVKSKGNRTSEAQRDFLKAVNERGGIGFVARSSDEAVQKLKGQCAPE